MDERVVATLACRSESTRLYGKPLQRIGDDHVLGRLLDQLERVDALDEIVLAISDSPSQSSYVAVAESRDLEYVVGPTEDVLGRLIQAANAVDGDVVVRTTTENPFVYWENLDDLVREDADLSVTRNLPHGAPIEVVSLAALEESHERGQPRHRSEHCTSYITEHPETFTIRTVDPPERLARPDVRVTVDNPCDLIFVREVYDRLAAEPDEIRLEDVVDVLEHEPELLEINDHKPDGTDPAVVESAPFRYGSSPE